MKVHNTKIILVTKEDTLSKAARGQVVKGFTKKELKREIRATRNRVRLSKLLTTKDRGTKITNATLHLDRLLKELKYLYNC